MSWPLGKPRSEATKEKMRKPKPSLLGHQNSRTKAIAPVGMSKHPLYPMYYQMIKKCDDPRHEKYGYFGAKNIHVCERWLEKDGLGFQNFLDDMGERPSPSHIFGRLNAYEDFSPKNCVWQEVKEASN